MKKHKYEIESIENGYLLTTYSERDSLIGVLMVPYKNEFYEDFDKCIEAIYKFRAEQAQEVLEEE